MQFAIRDALDSAVFLIHSVLISGLPYDDGAFIIVVVPKAVLFSYSLTELL
jgi:hypothetical protein